MVINTILAGAGKTTAPSTGVTPAKSGQLPGKNIPIVYLTHTGNTQAIGQMIQKNVGGRLVGTSQFLSQGLKGTGRPGLRG